MLPGGEVVLVAPAFRHITWNPDEYAAFRAAVEPADVVLEAGRNVGAYTMLFAQWAGAGWTCVRVRAGSDGLCRTAAAHRTQRRSPIA